MSNISFIWEGWIHDWILMANKPWSLMGSSLAMFFFLRRFFPSSPQYLVLFTSEVESKFRLHPFTEPSHLRCHQSVPQWYNPFVIPIWILPINQFSTMLKFQLFQIIDSYPLCNTSPLFHKLTPHLKTIARLIFPQACLNALASKAPNFIPIPNHQWAIQKICSME